MFNTPHRRGASLQSRKEEKSPINIYLKACNDHFVLPNLLPFCTGSSDRLQAANQALNDHNLKALTEMFVNVETILEVDLEGNASLTENSLVPFLQQLFGRCAQSRLERLSLRNTLRNATGPGIQEVLDVGVNLISTGVKKLLLFNAELTCSEFMVLYLDKSLAFSHSKNLMPSFVYGSRPKWQ